MYRLIFTAALVALVSACSVTTVDRTSTVPLTGTMGAPGYIGSGYWMDNYGGGPN
jgi:hypothetical protein